MSKILFLESVAGIAGDMFAASFLDAGLVTRQELAALPALVGLKDVEIVVTPVVKATMRATHVTVKYTGAESQGETETHLAHAHGEHHHPHGHSHPHSHDHDHPHDHAHDHEHAHGHEDDHEHSHEHSHTHHSDIDRMLERSRLDGPVRDLARKIFRLLAEAEADAHGMAVADVAFHEVGTVDSIMDVVMAAYCIGKVGPARLCATPVKVGRGVVKIAHGTHPVPPPASARLLVGMPAAALPEAIVRQNVELSTPTGLAILKALAPRFQDALPPGKVLAQGMGAGTMDLGAYPNVFRVMLIEGAEFAAAALPYEQDQVVEIVCNLDDDTPERIAWLAEQVLRQGALDAWIAPVTGKKGRAAVVLSVLATTEGWPALADWLLRQSSTFGVRHRAWDRLKLARKFESRPTPSGPVTHKIGSTTTGEVLKSKAEFEELRRHWEKPLSG